MKMKRRLLSSLLSLALVLGLMAGMSLTAYAATETYTKLMNDKTVVKFNNYNRYIIADNSTAENAGTVTLLAADTSFGKSKFHDSSNAYSGSTVKSKLDALTAEGGAFASVKDAIADTKLSDVGIDGAKLYLLSGDEANRVPNNVLKIDESWWLRSPVNTSKVKSVLGNGEISDDAVVSSESVGVVRPALQLDLSKVVFDSITNTFSLGTLYPLWVGGTQVTSTEHSGEGWSYDHNTKTLTLNGYSYNGEYNGVSYDGNESLTIVLNGYSYSGEKNGINSRGGALNIVLTGSNTIIPKEEVVSGIFVESPITLSGSGSLSIECSNTSSCIVSTNGDITIESGTVIAQGLDGLVSPQGDVIIKGGNVTLTGAKNGIIGNNVTISGGTVTATGGNGAISGSVKNAIAGTGWTDTAGTQGKTDIAINTTTGQKLDQYKKVRLDSATVNTKPAAKNLTYTGSAQELVTAGKAEGGTMQYSLDGTRYSTMIPKGTTAGDYTVYYKAVGDEEHTDSGSSSVKVTIAKAMPTVTAPTAKTLTYTGSAQELVNAGSTNDGKLYYAVTAENKAPADNLYATSIPTKTDAGTYFVWYMVDADDNHIDTDPACVTVTIAEAPPQPEPEPEPQPQPEPEPEPQPEPQPPRGLYITPGSVAPIQVKETVRLTAASDTGLSLKKVRWATSDKKVATVKNGVVTGKKAGTATITASVDQLSASIDIIVEDNTIPTGVHFADGTPKGFELADGIDLAPFVVLEPDTAVTKLKWSTSDKKVATVKNGKVNGKTAGTVVITATTANDFSASIELTVKDSSAPTDVWFADGAPTLVEVDDSIDLAPFVTLAPDTARTKLTWSTSDKKTASVRNGKVTGKNGSTVTITATTANGLSASIEITVKDTTAPTAAQLEAPPARPLGVKEKLKLNVTFEPADAKPKKIKWTSSNKKVATVNNKGEVTGKGQGTAVITATAGKVSASVEIVVVDYTMPTDIAFTEGVPTAVVVKGSIELAPYVKMAPDTAKSKLTWTTSDKKIATIKNGKVTGKGPGTATITVTPARNKALSATIEVTVTAAE